MLYSLNSYGLSNGKDGKVCSQLGEQIHLGPRMFKVVHMFRCDRIINNDVVLKTHTINYTSVEIDLIIFL